MRQHNKNRLWRIVAPYLALFLLYPGLSIEAASNNSHQLQLRLIDTLSRGEDASSILKELKAITNPPSGQPVRTGTVAAADLADALHLFQQRVYEALADRLQTADIQQSLLQSYTNLVAAHLILDDHFKYVENALNKNGALPEQQRRSQQAGLQYTSRIGQLLAGLADTLGTANDSAQFSDPNFRNDVLGLLQENAPLLAELNKPHAPPILRGSQLPYRQPASPGRTPVVSPTITPSYAQEATTQSEAADLAASPGAPLNQEILEKAKALNHDYILIYQFVRNEIKTEWYTGSMKGAVGTLRQMSGNDVDQANLLIALFRASGLPARYVQGVIELPIEAVMQSLGLKDPALAVKAIARAGIAHTPQIRGGKIAALQMEHTWVTVHVPYTNYRGAMVDNTGETWVPLAPALKQYQVTQGLDMLTGINYDSALFLNNYLSDKQAFSPLERLRKQIVDGLQLNSPDQDYETSLGSITPNSPVIGLLPNTMPVPVVAVTAETAVLPDSARQRVRFVIRQDTLDNSPIILDHTIDVSEVAGHRLTLSYLPATVADQQTMNLFGGLDYTPAYLLKLRPQIKLDGRQLFVGRDAVDMGREHRFEIQILTPEGTESVAQRFVAGSYHAIGLSAQNSVPHYVSDDPADTEYMAAKLLNNIAQTYNQKWAEAEDELAAIHRVALIRPLPSVVFVSNSYKVDRIDDRPQQMHWQGVTIDAALRMAAPFSQEDSSQLEKDWMRLSALQGATLEHQLFQELFLVESLSADKGLQLARSQGMTVHHIDNTNSAVLLPIINHPANVKADIENWLRLGMAVEIPDSLITQEGWQGSVWKVEQPETGAAGYFIAGGLAGGTTTTPSPGWLLEWLRQALSGANSPAANNDPLSAASISILSDTSWQEGVVGTEAPEALAVLVRDDVGRPVVGAPVTFTPSLGGGQLIAEVVTTDPLNGQETISETIVDGPVTVTTGDNGVVSVRYILGTDISQSSAHIYRYEGDKYQTKIGYNTIDAEVASRYGNLRAAYPFELIAYPDVPATLIRTNGGPIGAPVPDSVHDLIFMQVYDQYGNPISNVPINFQLSQSAPRAGGTSGRLDNGTLSKSEQTSSVGASAVVILGSGFSNYTLTVTAEGYALATYSKSYTLILPGLVFTYMAIVGSEGQNLAAARSGTAFEPIIHTGLTCFNRETNVWSPAYVEDVSITASNGGSTTPAAKVAGGWESRLTVSASPGINSVTFHADYANCIPRDQVKYPDGWPLSYKILDVFSLEPKVTNILNDGKYLTPFDGIYLTEEGTTLGTVGLKYETQPGNYKSVHTDIDILEDGVFASVVLGTGSASSGQAAILRSQVFKANSVYEAQIVMNRGSDVEVKSDPYPLPIRQKIFKSYTHKFQVSKDVDLVNQRVCEFGSQFEFNLTQDSSVTLTFTDLDNQNAKITLLNNAAFSAGDNVVDIDITDLTPGQYSFELTGVSAIDGHSETVIGFASSEFSTKNTLPVGATLVKGVNVHDGSLAVSVQDIDPIPGRGVPLEFKRTYSTNSDGIPKGMGYGWHHNFDSKVVITRCGEAVVIGGQGSGMRFVEDAQGNLVPLKGHHGTLIGNQLDQTFDFYAKDGTQYHYRNYGSRVEWNLEYIVDTNGNTTRLGYDPSDREFARLSSVQDAAGRSLTYRWEERNFTPYGLTPVIVEVTGPIGISVKFDYDEFGNLISADRDNGARIEQYAYSTDNSLPLVMQHKLIERTNPLGGVTSYSYSEGSFKFDNGVYTYTWPLSVVTSVQEAEGGSTSFNYDDMLQQPPRTTQVTDARNYTTSYTTNQYGAVTTITDPVGTTSMVWAADDVVMDSRTDANGVKTSYTYDADGNLLSEKVGGYSKTNTYQDFADKPWIKNRLADSSDRNGNLTRYTYDGNGNLTETIDPLGNATTNIYTSNGDLIRTIDPNGNIIRYTYDVSGYVETHTDGENGTQIMKWDELGRRVQLTDALGNVTKYEFDTLNNLLFRTDAKNSVHKFEYNAAGEKIGETDEEGRVTGWTRDLQGRIKKVTNPDGAYKNITYDGNGNKTSESDWLGNVTSFSYDGANRLTTQTEPLGRVTSYTYDPVGNKKTETDALNHVVAYVYDALNRPIQITDPAGGVTKIEYDGENKTVVTDALNRSITFGYDAANRLLLKTEPLGRTTSYDYDANGNKILQTDALARKQQYQYDGVNRLIRHVDANGIATHYEYDLNGNLTKEIDGRLSATIHHYDSLNRRIKTLDPVNSVTTFEYDKVGNKVTEIPPNGNIITHIYDSLNRLTKSSDSLGQLVAYSYDANGNKLTETDANGNVTSHTYNALNQLEQSDLPELRTVKYDYDLIGNKISETDARNNATSYDYDVLNRLVTVTDPLNNTIEYTYDAVGNKLTEKDKRNNVTTYTYDDLNQLLTLTDPLSQAVTYTYDLVGNKTSEQDKRGILTEYGYDRENRLIQTIRDQIILERNSYDEVGNLDFRTDAMGNITAWLYDPRNLMIKESRLLAAITNYTYDKMGNRLTERDPEGRITSWSYDLRNRVSSETDGENHATEYSYDGNSNRTSRKRPLGNTWSYAYDGADRLLTVTDPLNGVTEYSYDKNGNTLSQQDANNNVTGYTYDELNRRTATTYADGKSESYSYDANGNRTGLTDGKGQSFSYVYDALNRETLRSYPATMASDYLVSIGTLYDANNNPLSHTETYSSSGTQTTSKSYDRFDRLLSDTDAYGKQVSYTYDRNGNRATLTDPDGFIVRYTYDELNRLSYLVSISGLTTYTYDRSSRITKLRHANGSEAQSTYDKAGRILTRHNLQGLNTISRYDYQYDANGNRTQQIEENGGTAETTHYTFDDNDRLLEVSYPDAGQGCPNAASAGCAGAAQTVTYTYDAAYNRTGEKAVSSADSSVLSDKTYAYNNRNQLETITDNLDAAQNITYQYDNNGNQVIKSKNGSITTFVYDARDRLISVRQDATTLGQFRYNYRGQRIEKSGADGLIRYRYDDSSILHQHDGDSGLTVARYEYGADSLLSLFHTTEGRQHYLYDALGSTVNLSTTGGTLQARYSYDAWGHYRATAGTSWNKYTFTGHEKDEETGLYYFKARFYDPDTGRFGTQDAYLGDINTPPSVHRYLYAYANPTVYVDLNGYESIKWYSEEDIPHDTNYWVINRGGGDVYYNADESAYDDSERYSDVAGMADALGSERRTVDKSLWTRATDSVTNLYDKYNDWRNGGNKVVAESESEPGSRVSTDDIPSMQAQRQHNIDKMLGRGEDVLRQNAPDPERVAEAAKTGGITTAVVVGIEETGKVLKNPLAKATEKLAEKFGSKKSHASEPDWKVAPHGEMPSPRPSGYQSHHGVNSVWADGNVEGYTAKDAPAVLMKNNPYHNATRGVFNRIRSELAQRQGVSTRNIDWSEVSPGTAWRIAEEQFDAAKVPQAVRERYFLEFNKYLDTLR